jgi:ferredoxin
MAYIISSDCVSCGTCADSCPVSAISQGASQYVIDPDVCVSCGACASNCPVDAIAEG